jgi:hypothetical protein
MRHRIKNLIYEILNWKAFTVQATNSYFFLGVTRDRHATLKVVVFPPYNGGQQWRGGEFLLAQVTHRNYAARVLSLPPEQWSLCYKEPVKWVHWHYSVFKAQQDGTQSTEISYCNKPKCLVTWYSLIYLSAHRVDWQSFPVLWQTPWKWFLLEELIVTQPVKKFLGVCGTRWFTTAFISHLNPV